MTLLPSIDTVVRQFMPIVLDAAGESENANKFRDLEPILTIDSAKLACKELSNVSHEDPVWIFVIEDLAFWIEAAVWAAVRNDRISFVTDIDRAHAILCDGLDVLNRERILS